MKLLYPKLRQLDTKHVPWWFVQQLVGNYQGLRIRETDNINSPFLKSFKLPIGLIEKLQQLAPKYVYLGLGYHDSANGNVTKTGITLIVLGVDNNKNPLSGGSNVLWDVNSISDPNYQNISYDDALSAMDRYQNLNMPRFETYYPDGNSREVEKKTKGFMAERDMLDHFIGRQRSVDQVECILGIHGDYGDENEQRGHTLAFVGNGEDGDPADGRLKNTIVNHGDLPTSNQDIALDYVDPCPRECPVGF